MRREIICLKCDKEMEEIEERAKEHIGPDEYVKRVYGTALEDYICDHCGKEIRKGEKCSARTVVLQKRTYIPWEHGSLHVEDEREWKLIQVV